MRVGPPESVGGLGAVRPVPAGPGTAPAADSKPGRHGDTSPRPAVTRRRRRQEKRRLSPGPLGRGHYCLLTWRALCGFLSLRSALSAGTADRADGPILPSASTAVLRT